MKTVKKDHLPFESIDNELYIQYLERAEMFLEKGYSSMNIKKLAKILYEKDLNK